MTEEQIRNLIVPVEVARKQGMEVHAGPYRIESERERAQLAACLADFALRPERSFAVVARLHRAVHQGCFVDVYATHVVHLPPHPFI